MNGEQQIAKITDTFLGFEDHGLLTASVTLTYGGASQSIGHRCFGSVDESRSDWSRSHERGMDFVRRLLLACGVNRWEQLKGRTVLVTATHCEVQRVDPLPTEHGESFDIVAWAKEAKADA